MEYVFIVARQLGGIIILHKLRAAYCAGLFFLETVRERLLSKGNHIEVNFELILLFALSEEMLEQPLATNEEDYHVSHAKDCKHPESDEYCADVC
jgi:hypothetical protein